MSNEAVRPLLATKLFIPPLRKALVLRPRLLEKLDESHDQRLILVTAPAGFGKTTLVACWLAQRQKKAAWISLDKNDNSPLIFLSYVVEAVEQIETGLCASLSPLLQSPDPPAVSVILSYLLNDLTRLQGNCVLVFDDYHVIHSDEVHQVLDYMIENAPVDLQINITSRQTPSISIPKLRARHELTEVSAIDLRFNHDETNQFFQDVMHLHLSVNEIADLEKQTEGWVTGLQLAAIGLKDRQDRARFIRDFSGDDRFIADYLVDEVLSYQETAVQQFLMQTAILRRFNASLCNTLLNIENAHEILWQLEQDNLFLVALDNKRDWFRYHHLFGEMLRSRLEQREPDLLPTLYLRTIEWHVENGQIEEAIEYAIECQNYERAAELLKSIIDQQQSGLQQKRLLNWLQQFPLELLRRHNELWPKLILSQFYFSDFDQSLDLLYRLWHDAPTDDSQITLVKGIENTLRSAIALHTTLDGAKVRAFNQQALVMLPDLAYLMRSIAMGHYGSASLLLGDLESAHSYLANAIQLLERTDNWAVLHVFQNYQAEATAVQGNLHKAAELFRKIHHYAHNRDLHDGATYSGTLIGLGLLHYEWNELEEAERLIDEGRRFAEPNKSLERLLQSCYATMKLQLAQGQSPKITAKLDHIERVAAEYDYPLLVMDRLESLRSLQALHKGELQTAARWAHLFTQRYPEEISCARQREWLTVAQIWLQTEKTGDAVPLLQRLQQLALEETRQFDLIKITAVLVNAWYQLGKKEQALSELRKLLIAAEPEGYLRTFVDQGKGMRILLEGLLRGDGRSHPQLPYIQQILNAFAPHKDPSQILQILTPRELEVVALLSEGLTYAQIQNRLTITENTLKTHIKRIYSKLHVHNRVQAVLTAQEKGLI
jgi:LuxR family maltose regulon positive regulatory protein